MEFDWLSAPFDHKDFSLQEVEEAFEDPFSIRLLPDDSCKVAARYFLLGKSISGTHLFCVFRTDGKNYRVIAARPMTPEETAFYERKNADLLA